MVCGWGDAVTGEHEDALHSPDGVGTKGFWTLVTGEEGRAQTSLEGCVWSLGGF